MERIKAIGVITTPTKIPQEISLESSLITINKQEK